MIPTEAPILKYVDAPTFTSDLASEARDLGVPQKKITLTALQSFNGSLCDLVPHDQTLLRVVTPSGIIVNLNWSLQQGGSKAQNGNEGIRWRTMA